MPEKTIAQELIWLAHAKKLLVQIRFKNDQIIVDYISTYGTQQTFQMKESTATEFRYEDIVEINFLLEESHRAKIEPDLKEQKNQEDDDWRLTPEKRDEFFRSARPSYGNRRHLNRLGD